MTRAPKWCATALGQAGLLALLLSLETVGAAPQDPKAAPPVIVGGGPVAGKKVAQLQVPQPPQPGAPGPSGGPEFTDRATLPTDRQIKKTLEAAQDDYIKDENWAQASNLLQNVLNTKEDVFLPVKQKDASGREHTHWVSARTEANRLLGTMPPKGLEFYELQYGPPANDLLRQAKATADPQLLADVALRYFHTRAGAEATDLLGTYHLDRGGYVAAAESYRRLLQREGADQLGALTLFKAALAFRRAHDQGYAALADATQKRLLAVVSRDGLKAGDETLSADVLRTELNAAAVTRTAMPHAWTMMRGNARRTAVAEGGAPFLHRNWQRPMADGPDFVPYTKAMVQQAANERRPRSEPALPAFFPVATAGKVIFRSYIGVHAIDLKSGEELWNSPYMDASLNKLLKEPKLKPEVGSWYESYRQGSYQDIVFENSTVGTLSSDSTRVYAVDDLGVPPHPSLTQFAQQWGGPGGFNPRAVDAQLLDLANHNRLAAFDIETGKIVWEWPDRERPDKPANPEFDKTFFLGPPLPIGGKLYVLTEKNAELRLLCLDAAKGDLIWAQTLATVRDRLTTDVKRRIQAVQLAYGEGALICPTNAGVVIAVDPLTRGFLWAYPYQEKTPEAPVPSHQPMMRRGRGFPMDFTAGLQGLSGGWKLSAPVIADGKVVFTAPDGGAVHCLNLSTGEFLWQLERRDDLYLAGVFDGKVVLVGKNSCRAVSLADGKTRLWEVETGLPSGQGVASGSTYFLPLKKGEILAIDMDHGQVVAHNPSPKDEVPGNLLFYEGDMVSQNELYVTAYPQVDAKVAAINQQLKTNPHDPAALTERGELRLYKGDLTGALADLRDAVGHKPPAGLLPKTREKLYVTLTQLLQRDFNAAEPYLDEYRQLCTIPVPATAKAEERQKLQKEQQQRQSGYLTLLARGREQQGRLTEAFRAYLEFDDVTGDKELVTVLGDPSVKAQPRVWAQGRIAALVARATPEQRKPLEAEIERRWRDVQKAKDIEPLRRFVGAFGSLFAVGREARFRLSERLIEENALLEAELHLLQLRGQADDRVMAGRAVEALARLMARKGLLEDAVYYYRILGKDYATVPVRGGKTGADILKELSTDKRFLPYLDQLDLPLFGATIRVSVVPGGAPPLATTRPFEARTAVLPYFQRHQLAWASTSHSGTAGAYVLKVFDRDTHEERWSFATGPSLAGYLFNDANLVRSPYYTRGHLAVVCLGHTFYGLDVAERKKLWEKPLLTSETFTPGAQQQFISLDRDGTVLLSNAQGTVERLGQIGPVGASFVCLRTQDGLVAVDPVRGQELWTRADVSPQTQLFGDDELVYLAEVRADGTVGTTRAVRGRDGAAADVPDFAAVYQHRQRVLGGRLLVSENDPRGGHTVRVYDVRTGKDLWKKTFSAGSVLLRHEGVGELAGVIEPDGKLLVLDLDTCREVLHAQAEREHLANVNDGLLLTDGRQYYAVLNRPLRPDPNVQGPTSNLSGLRSTLVNGTVYAFDAAGELNWYLEMPAQMMMLEQFAELPMIVFTANFVKAAPNMPGGQRRVVDTVSVDKRTGKRLWNAETDHSSGSYTALRFDRGAGTIDLVSYNSRLRHTVERSTTRVPPRPLPLPGEGSGPKPLPPQTH